MDRVVLGPDGFVCSDFAECRASARRKGDRFFEGQSSFVGNRYDLNLNGQALRIVVVGQEYALNSKVDGRLKRRRVTLDERYRMVAEVTGRERRYYASDGHAPRNPHMRGTTSALRLLMGAGTGADHEGEWIAPSHGKPFHIFDGFALVNRLLCAAGRPGEGQGHSTTTMRANCLRHFEASLRILEPTVLILQGEGVQRWTAEAVHDECRLSDHLSIARTVGGEAFVCRFSHPTARGAKRWGDRLDAPYLTEVVAPTMLDVRQAIGSGGEPRSFGDQAGSSIHAMANDEGAPNPEHGREAARKLRALGVRGVLITAAERGLITQVVCRMPECFCPEELGGACYFEPVGKVLTDWRPTPDHYRVLKKDGGHLTVDNVRLAHRLCNRVDYSKQIGRSYAKDLARVESARTEARSQS